MSRIGVLGAGTWGMALARMLSNTGNDVQVWSAREKEVDEYSATRRHPNLPGMVIPDAIRFTKDIREVCAGKDILLIAIPSNFLRSVARNAAPFVEDGQIIVNVGKGIEAETVMTLTEVIEDELHKAGRRARVVALSGPTHAEEVAKDLPTTIVAASVDMDAAREAQKVFTNDNMRVYTNDDVRGIQLCGAFKNIIALASGICSGLGYGDNTRAALITRGLAEIMRLGTAMGCRQDTFAGLAGVGDLIVTATSMHSRNNRAGMLMGQGKTAEEAVKEVGMVVEGIYAIPAALKMAELYHIELPIIFAVDAVVNHGADPRQTVRDLMLRNTKPEWD